MKKNQLKSLIKEIVNEIARREKIEKIKSEMKSLETSGRRIINKIQNL